MRDSAISYLVDRAISEEVILLYYINRMLHNAGNRNQFILGFTFLKRQAFYEIRAVTTRKTVRFNSSCLNYESRSCVELKHYFVMLHSIRKKQILYSISHQNIVSILHRFLCISFLFFFLSCLRLFHASFSSFILSLCAFPFLTSFLSLGIVVCQPDTLPYSLLQYFINAPYQNNTASDVTDMLHQQQFITVSDLSWGFHPDFALAERSIIF